MEKRSKPADFSDLAKKARDSRARRQLLYRHGVPDEAEQVLFKPYFDEEEDTMADVRGKDVSFMADRKAAVDYLRTVSAFFPSFTRITSNEEFLVNS